jgi:hypothetical protein
MLPTSVLTNRKTAQSFLAHLLPPLLRRLGLYLALQGLLLCNKLGLLAHYYTVQVCTMGREVSIARLASRVRI